MGYFPFFVDLSGKTGLVVGGGKVALRKVKNLLPYGAVIRVSAPVICDEIRSLPDVELLERGFRPEDLEGCSFAVAATDNRQVNHAVAELCKEKNIPVNVIDDGSDGTFLFPSLVRQGSLSVGICSGGKYPMASSYFKREIEALVPENMEDILDFLAEQRSVLKKRIPEKKIRDQILSQLCCACMECGAPLTEAETEKIVSAFAENGGRDGK